MSLFAEYIKELKGKSIIEDEKGFATYFAIPGGMYIEDIYVKQAYRKDGIASYYADEIVKEAKKLGLNKLYGSVNPSNNNSTISMKVLLSYGFKIDSSANDAIVLSKEI